MRLLLALAGLAMCGLASGQSCPAAQHWDYQRLGEQARDSSHFTQGLTFVGDTLVESTGLYGHSRLIVHHQDHPQTLNLPDQLFGEGLALHKQRLWQLSWKAGQLRIYTLDPLALEKTLQYQGEGWGLTSNGSDLIRSDGSPWLSFHNATDFSPIKRLKVHDGQRPIRRLNELEWVDDQILANIWFSDKIVSIDPDSGCVRAWLDLGALWPQAERPPGADVLNGIAWHAGRQELWVTGKNWPRIYRLDVPALKRAAAILDDTKIK